jgi:NADH dehydrogenase [ubiquinone] 1 alpha subcomplex assembly factor 7
VQQVSADDDDPSAQLSASLRAQCPVSLADYMASANTVYYGTRDPLGVDGDFITAPEISQMFGELIGLWFADLWMRMDKPRVHYVELGPGRGTLAKDALRAMAMVGLTPEIHLVETSAVLRLRQAENLHDPCWHLDIESLPRDAPLLVMANEFFDALPIHQIVRGATGWHQRDVVATEHRFAPALGRLLPEDIVPEPLRDAEEGSIIETSPASVRIIGGLAARIAAQGGAGLMIDYGYDGPALGDTFQAVKAHAFADPFEAPGERDLTAHVDFVTLAAMAELNGARVQGPVGQGQFLARLGLVERAAALSSMRPGDAERIAGERDRLAGIDQMGRLFRAMAFRHPNWPEADGF